MKKLFVYPLLIVALAFTAGCNKDSESFDNSCEKLSAGLATDNASVTGEGVNQLINGLSSTDYSPENLENLATKMSAGCGVTTEVTCLNCNHGVPLETELTAHFTVAGVEKQKIIVITHTPGYKMLFHSIHD